LHRNISGLVPYAYILVSKMQKAIAKVIMLKL